MALNTLTLLYSHLCYSSLESFHLLKRKLHIRQTMAPHLPSLPQSLATFILLSVSMKLMTGDT